MQFDIKRSLDLQLIYSNLRPTVYDSRHTAGSLSYFGKLPFKKNSLSVGKNAISGNGLFLIGIYLITLELSKVLGR